MKEKDELEKRNEVSDQKETHEIASDENVLNATELFAVEGGEDEDLDEDCQNYQCVVAANICINVSTACVFSN